MKEMCKGSGFTPRKAAKSKQLVQVVSQPLPSYAKTKTQVTQKRGKCLSCMNSDTGHVTASFKGPHMNTIRINLHFRAAMVIRPRQCWYTLPGWQTVQYLQSANDFRTWGTFPGFNQAETFTMANIHHPLLGFLHTKTIPIDLEKWFASWSWRVYVANSTDKRTTDLIQISWCVASH